MRRLIAVALGLVTALSVAMPASAASNADDIVGALKKAPVYVVSGTEGTTSDTVGTLTSKLYKDDNIVLAMLPADPSITQDDVTLLAQQVSNGLKGKRIVGIAVGTQFAGVTSMMPSGTASDLMNRAQTVSTNSVETLITFVRNVHDWQSQNPQYVPASKPAKATSGSFPWFLIVIGALLAVLIAIFIIFNRRRIRSRVHYTAPGEMNDPVEKMMKLREHLRDDEAMYNAIDEVCRYTEAYFKRFTSEKRNSDTVTLFSNQLELARKVVEDYVYTYEDSQYVDEPEVVLKRGLDSIQGLAETILISIKKGNNDRLMDYKVNTNILNAQRTRNIKSPK